MVRAVTAKCERCGAELHPEEGSDRVKCMYCGTTSLLQKSRMPQAPTVVVKPHGVLPVVALAAAVAVLGAAVALVALRAGSPQSGPDAKPAASPAVAAARTPTNEPAREPAKPAEAPEEVRAEDGFRPLFTDVDGDGQPELIARVSITKAGSTTHGFATFDPRSGVLRSRTQLPEGSGRALQAVLGRHLVIAQSNGKLSAFDLSSGKEAWSSMLGERTEKLCEGGEPGEVMVVADTGRHLLLDLTTGRQTVTKKPCQRALAYKRSQDPRDRRDYRAPAEVESYQCGSVRVMGSESYTIADQCLVRARVNTDALDGMVGHALWRAGKDWLVFGVRQPGAYIPMVGRLRGGKLAWKTEVPLDNPLEAQEGGPREIALVGSELVVTSYATDKGRKSFVTAFATSDGARRFTVDMPAQVKAINASAAELVVQAGTQLLLLDPANGETLKVLGAP